ncbi:MAG: N-acetylmuramoyl-L-alanine amidase [Bacillota bacterium]|nr:N-acetylmuramoyl-L-alanine amidase [Bacillota bacterium]
MKNRKINFLIMGIILCAILCAPGYKEVAQTVSKLVNMPVVVLDPGHGGIDGGAESSGGMSEKDINLDIAKMLKKQLEKRDVRVIMTREKDEGLYDENQAGAIRSLKTQDLKERKRIIDESGADLAVSIHLNSFTEDAGVHGAQVFYPAYGEELYIDESKRAAKILQQHLNEDINVTVSRSELAKGDVFLLEDVKCPIVIVECGFLSNPEDARNLGKAGHQKKISQSMEKSISKFLKEKNEKN